MKLTRYILDQISWWEHTTKRGTTMGGQPTMTDVFTLHFKRWWQWRKTISIPWRNASYDNDTDIVTLHQSEGGKQLLDQLNNCLLYPGS